MRPYTKTITILLIFLVISIILISTLSPESFPQTKMANTNPTTAYEFLHIIPNTDGTLTRLAEFYPTVPPNSSSSETVSKDVPLNQDNQTWIRLFLPRQVIDNLSDKKLPILVHVHGGGFVLCSAASPVFHDVCSLAASRLNALVVSVEYRLAPEHRLPAAYDDVLEALTWVKDLKDEWVRKYGDLSKCVLMGDSAGGNIVYHVGLMASNRINDFQPLTIKGLVLNQPFFSGLNRTGSELRLVDDPVLRQDTNDLMWELGLPVGADRSHEFCDPTLGGGSRLLDRVRDLGWKVRVLASDSDPLFDRDVELVKLMERKGLNVKSFLTKGDKHGAFVNDKEKSQKLFDFVMDLFS